MLAKTGFATRHRLHLIIVAVSAMICMFGLTTRAAADAYHPYRLIVKYKSPPATTSLQQTAAKALAANVKTIFPVADTKDRTSIKNTGFIYTFADSLKRLAAESLLSNDPAIQYVERDYKMELFSDPLYQNQWGLTNQAQGYLGIVRVPGNQNDSLVLKTGTAGADIRWEQTQSAPINRHKTRVGVIDTGVDYKHPDLQDHIWHNVQEIPGNGIDDDLNGYVDDYYGYDFSGDTQSTFNASPDSDPMDKIGHGTHVSGIIGAVGGNGIGIEGIAQNVEIMCLKIFPNAYASSTSAAIIYAVDNGAEVINASWGSPFYSSIIDDAVKYAVEHGVVFVAASGNSGTDIPFFPAKSDFVVTVGASDSHDQVTYFSSFGPWLDLAAPGLDILSLRATGTDLYAASGEPGIRIIDSLYYLADGTSMAAPHVTGAVALLRSASPGLTADSIKQLLYNTADAITDPNGLLRHAGNPYSGHGRLNVGRATEFLSDEFAELESPQFNTVQQGIIQFSGSAYSASGKSFLLEARPASTNTWITIASGSANLLRQSIANWDSSPYDGRTEVRLTVGDNIAFTSYLRLVNNPRVDITTPANGDTVTSFAEIIGSASAPGLQSYEVSFYPDAAPREKHLITFSNQVLYDSPLAEWTIGPLRPGSGVLKLTVTTATDVIETSTGVYIKSSLAAGYPIEPITRPHLSAMIGNIDDDPAPELVSGGSQKIIVNHFKEGRIEYINPPIGQSCQSTPALWDFNGDGKDEIVVVTDSGVAIIDGLGNPLPGWPKLLLTGWEYDSYPTPLLADLDGDGRMEILVTDAAGEVWCWRWDGSSYFHSTGGLFGLIDDLGRARNFGGAIVAFMFAYDFDDDGYQDVGVLYTSYGGDGGLYMLSGKNGNALYPDKGIRVLSTEAIFGGVLADFDNDGYPEIAFAHRAGGVLRQIGVSIVRANGDYLPGWPKIFYDKIQWLSPYPAAADLDHDSIPELICVFSALDGGELYVWHGDGTPFRGDNFGRNDGFLAGTSNSLSNPEVLDVDNDGQ